MTGTHIKRVAYHTKRSCPTSRSAIGATWLRASQYWMWRGFYKRQNRIGPTLWTCSIVFACTVGNKPSYNLNDKEEVVDMLHGLASSSPSSRLRAAAGGFRYQVPPPVWVRLIAASIDRERSYLACCENGSLNCLAITRNSEKDQNKRAICTGEIFRNQRFVGLGTVMSCASEVAFACQFCFVLLNLCSDYLLFYHIIAWCVWRNMLFYHTFDLSKTIFLFNILRRSRCRCYCQHCLLRVWTAMFMAIWRF